MGFKIKNIILVLLFCLVINTSYDPVLFYQEVNDGQTANLCAVKGSLKIITKIEKNSQIVVDIKMVDKKITKDNVRYSKFYKDSNTTAFAEVTAFVEIGDKHYKCTYDVSKDTNDYGMLWIKDLSLGEQLTVSVSVYGKITVWIIVAIVIAVALVLFVIIFCILRKFLRCCIL